MKGCPSVGIVGRRALWREVLVLAGLCCDVLATPGSNESFGAKLRLAACSCHPWALSFIFWVREGEAGGGEEKWHGFFEQSLSKSQNTLWKKKKTRKLHPFTTETSQPHPKPWLARDSFLTLRNRKGARRSGMHRDPEIFLNMLEVWLHSFGLVLLAQGPFFTGLDGAHLLRRPSPCVKMKFSGWRDSFGDE